MAALGAREVDGVGGAFRDGPGGVEVRATTDDGQDPAAVRRPAVGGPGGAGVEDERAEPARLRRCR